MKKLLCSVLILVLAAITMLSFCACSDNDGYSENDDGEVFLYPADYDEDIFENSAYTDKVTDVKYIESGYSVLLDSSNYDSADEYEKLFYRFFDSIKHGDAQQYISYIASDYFNDKNPAPEKFTMQKLYDIEVSYVEDLELEYNGENIKVKDFIVRYKIMYNNGTFRADLPSDAVIPQHFLVGETEGELKILNIVDIN